jgi:hypothetical protein
MLPSSSGSKNKPSMKAGGKQRSMNLFLDPEDVGDMLLRNVG